MFRSHATALQDELEILYNYQEFKAEWLARTLRERKIRCSNPARLNDRWDCRPWFDSQKIQSDPETFRKAMDSFHRQAKEPLPLHLKEKFENGIRADPKKAEDFMAGLSTAFQG